MSVSLQMIALRQIVPFVGSSVPITSIVISGFLAALAMGYSSGGKFKNDLLDRVGNNFLTVAMFIALFMNYFFVLLAYASVSYFTETSIVFVAVYVVLVLMPMVYFLSQTVIILVNFQKSSDASEKAGDNFNISTWGNVAGSLITVLVVMYYLSVGWANIVNVVILIIAYLLIPSEKSISKVLVVVCLLFLAVVTNVIADKSFFDRSTAYANYQITDDDAGGKLLHINNSNSSLNNKGIGHDYIEYFEKLAIDEHQSKSIIVLGAGGFTFGLGRQLENVDLKFIDVDSALHDVAKNFLDKTENLPFIVSDARNYLITNADSYDAIVIDTYSHLMSIPDHLVTLQFFKLVRSRLNQNGLVLINTISKREKITRFSRSLDNTIRSVFSNCELEDIGNSFSEYVNRLYVCKRDPLDNVKTIYSDNNSKAGIEKLIR